MVELLNKKEISKKNEGLYIVQNKEGSGTMRIGSIDEALKEFSKGDVTSMHWRSKTEIERILDEQALK